MAASVLGVAVSARPVLHLTFGGRSGAGGLRDGRNDFPVSCAEDIVQEAFVEWLRRYDEVESPVPYLGRAVVSRCTSWIRRRIVERRHAGVVGHPPDDPLVVDSPDGHAVAVRSALARISPRQR